MIPEGFEENERLGSFPEPPRRDPGRFMEGCGIGCLVQLGALLLAIAGAYLATGRASVFLASSFAVTQWFALIPMIRKENSKGRGQTAGGLIASGIGGVIVGSIVLLVGSACGPGTRN